MGRVFRGRAADGQGVALKLLPRAFADDPGRIRRFEIEAAAAARVDHPNVVRLLAVGVDGGHRFLVTELLVGSTLRAHLARGPLAAREVVRLALELARGLEALHAAGVIHRDLKPENLFVVEGGRLAILDLGIARVDGLGGGTLTDAGTAPGAILGTAGYMAPEQVRGLNADARSDVFALGAILHELATGQRAFPGDTAIDRASAIVRDTPPPILRTDLPAAYATLVAGCLEKAPERRPSQASVAVAALTAIEAARARAEAPTDPGEAHPTAPSPPASSGAPRGRWVASWIASLVVVAWIATRAGGASAPLRTALLIPPAPPPPIGGWPGAPTPPASPDLPPDVEAALDEDHEIDAEALEALATSTVTHARLADLKAVLGAKLAEAAAELASRELARDLPAERAGQHVLRGDNVNERVSCPDEGGFTLQGDNGVVHVEGDCGIVVVRGHDNVVEVDSSELIVVAGDRNVVSYGNDADAPPKLLENGRHNVIERR
jgi:serine/threonine protein kinase